MDYVLGIDGGGTKTLALAADLQGNVLGRGVSGASNYHTVGLSGAILALKEALEGAIADAGGQMQECRAVCFGLAGIGRERDRALVLPAISKLNLTERVILEHDAAIALAGALACQPGVVIMAGTGAMAFGMNRAGERKRSGGWGNLLGDEGSAYYIGRRALAAACKAYDGRGPETALVEELIKHLSLRNFTDIVIEIYESRMPVQITASLAPLVSRLAMAGDGVAAMIIKDAAEELALAASAVIRGLNMESQEFQIAVSGSVFKAGEPLLKPFAASVKSTAPRIEVVPPRFEPAMGAVLLALQEVGAQNPRK